MNLCARRLTGCIFPLIQLPNVGFFFESTPAFSAAALTAPVAMLRRAVTTLAERMALAD